MITVPFQLTPDRRWQDRHRQKLRMRVHQRGAGVCSDIAEVQVIAQPKVTAQIPHSLCRSHQAAGMKSRGFLYRHRFIVRWTVNDDFVGAEASPLIVHTDSGPGVRFLDPERRISIRNDPEFPPSLLVRHGQQR
jgi:hypothetical protein